MSGVIFNNFDALGTQLHDALKQVVVKTAFDGQANIQSQIQANGSVDTGFMLNSVYTVTAEGSTYGQGGSPPKDATLLPSAEAPSDDLTAYIGVGASYAEYVNYGTSHMAPKPFFEPGIDQTQPRFQAACDAAMSKLGTS